MDKYYIIYPRGDKSKLSIISLSMSLDYEISDYKLASRREFYDMEECIEYAKELAKKHNLPLSSLEREIQEKLEEIKGIGYLD